MTKLLEPSSRASNAGLQMVDASFTTLSVINSHNLTYMGGAQNQTITAAETAFFPQSRQSYALIRQNLIFS
jgi:heptaprenylglyceryl phosphate synthase